MFVLSLVFAACGGGDDSPSREDFANGANQVCRETEKDLENLSTGRAGTSSSTRSTP
jgi:hypothetical protein